MNNIIDGKLVSSEIRETIKLQIKNCMIKPCLAVIQVGNDPASDIYIKAKEKACTEVGMYFKHIKYHENILEKEIINKIIELNNDEYVNGILIQLPLPKNLNFKKIANYINSNKDVDGLTDINIGRLINGKECMIPCTALGIIELLNYYHIEIESKNVVIVGRSNLVGKPLLSLFLNNNATVTICHLKTANLADYTQTADILVVATGKKHLIKENDVKNDAVVIDVGVTREENKIYGDVDFDNVISKCSYITPSIGGVGPMTVAMLLKNVLKSYQSKN